MILLATQSVRMSEVYEIIDWRLLILIACMMSFGVAMEKTRADQYLADLIVRGTGQYGPVAVLAGFFIMTVALTQPMSNQAAALVMLPISVKTALALGLNPRTFAVTVTYAASCSFLTPLRARLRPRLHTGTLSLCRLFESRFATDDSSICDRHLVSSGVLAVLTFIPARLFQSFLRKLICSLVCCDALFFRAFENA